MHSDAEAKALFFFLFPSHFLLIFSGGSSLCQLPCSAPISFDPHPLKAGISQLAPAQRVSLLRLFFPLPSCLLPVPPVRQLSWAQWPWAGFEQAGREDRSARRPVTHSSGMEMWFCFSPRFCVCLFCCSAAISSAELSDSRSWSLTPQLPKCSYRGCVWEKGIKHAAFSAAPDEMSKSSAKMPPHTAPGEASEQGRRHLNVLLQDLPFQGFDKLRKGI